MRSILDLHCLLKKLDFKLFLLVLLLTGCYPITPQQFDKSKVTMELQTSLDSVVLNSDGKIDRHALLFIDAPTVDFSFEGAAGIARVDTREPMTVDRQFSIASVGKAMTAVIIYQLSEEGAFGNKGTDTTLAELGVLPPEVITELHQINGVSYGNEITLRHLLNQTSGLRDVFFDSVSEPVSLMPGTAEGASPDSFIGMLVFDKQYGLIPLVKCKLEGIPAGCNPDDYLFRHKWPAWNYEAWKANPNDKMAGLLNFYLMGMNKNALWKPGGGFHYADTNYILLGLVIEKMTGNSLHKELRTRIFDPLRMSSTYLIGGVNPPAEIYEKQPLADAWAWNEPSISGGVDYSFDWGGGGIASTLSDLQSFTQALVAGKLFRHEDTLKEMLTVPEGIQGIYYASGMIVFPTEDGPVMYMMGSNGTWVEYYFPLKLTMIGTTDDYSNLPIQFILHAQIYQLLADHGLQTPMAKQAGLASLLSVLGLVLWIILLLIWSIMALIGKRKKVITPACLKQAHWLTAASFIVNLVMLVLIVLSFGDNQFQMLFGYTPQVRMVLLITGLLMGAFALVMALVAVRLWKSVEVKTFIRIIFTTIVVVLLIYGASLYMLGS